SALRSLHSFPTRRSSDLFVFLLVLFAISAIKVAREYERGIVFRLGRLLPEPKGPGLFILIPIVDRMVRVDLRTITLNIPPQEVKIGRASCGSESRTGGAG